MSALPLRADMKANGHDVGYVDPCRASSRSLLTIGVAIAQGHARSAQPEEGVE